MMLGPKAQALLYLVPTKYLFLPYSQTQSSEIPFLLIITRKLLLILHYLCLFQPLGPVHDKERSIFVLLSCITRVRHFDHLAGSSRIIHVTWGKL